MPAAYNATCDDWLGCGYTQSKYCKPVECAIPSFEGTAYPARVFYNETLIVACKEAYRYKSRDVNGPKNYSLSCNENCSLSESPSCLPITCNSSWLLPENATQWGIHKTFSWFYPEGSTSTANLSGGRQSISLNQSVSPTPSTHFGNRTFLRNLSATSMTADENFRFYCLDDLIADGSPPGECLTSYDVHCTDDGGLQSHLGSFRCVPRFCDLRLLQQASDNWNFTRVYSYSEPIANGTVKFQYLSFQALYNYSAFELRNLSADILEALGHDLGADEVSLSPGGVECNFTVTSYFEESSLGMLVYMAHNNLSSRLDMDDQTESIETTSHVMSIRATLASKLTGDELIEQIYRNLTQYLQSLGLTGMEEGISAQAWNRPQAFDSAAANSLVMSNRSSFSLWDANGDGCVSEIEFVDFFCQGHCAHKDPAFASISTAADTDFACISQSDYDAYSLRTSMLNVSSAQGLLYDVFIELDLIGISSIFNGSGTGSGSGRRLADMNSEFLNEIYKLPHAIETFQWMQPIMNEVLDFTIRRNDFFRPTDIIGSLQDDIAYVYRSVNGIALELLPLFADLDVDGDGCISTLESIYANTAVRELAQDNDCLSSAHFDAYMRNVRTNGDIQIARTHMIANGFSSTATVSKFLLDTTLHEDYVTDQPRDVDQFIRQQLISAKSGVLPEISKISGQSLSSILIGFQLEILHPVPVLISTGNSRVQGGSHIMVACEAGYSITGTNGGARPRYAFTSCLSSQCAFDSLPVCKPAQCNASAMPPANARITDISAKQVVGNYFGTPVWSQSRKSMYYGQVLNVSCDALHIVEDSARGDIRTWFPVTCGSDGELLGVKQCVRANCGDYVQDSSKGSLAWFDPNVASILPVLGSITNRQAQVTCAPGYRHSQTNIPFVTCSNNDLAYNLSCAPDLEYYPLKHNDKDISQIRIRSGLLIDKIEFSYRDGTSTAHGTNSGEIKEPFILNSGEKLVRMLVRQGEHLDGCQFFVSSGRVSPWYGGHGGSSISFNASADEPITDILRASQYCGRILSVVKANLSYPDICAPLACKPFDALEYAGGPRAYASTDEFRLFPDENHRISIPEYSMFGFTQGQDAGNQDGLPSVARLNQPARLTLWSDGGKILVTDKHKLRALFFESGIVSTVAGSHVAGFNNGRGTDAMFNNPGGIAIGRICEPTVNYCDILAFIADSSNHRIRRVALRTSDVTTLAGASVSSFSDGAPQDARFSNPSDCACDDADCTNLLIADSGNNRIRKMHLASAQVTTLSGTGYVLTAPAPDSDCTPRYNCTCNNCTLVDGQATIARFSSPRALAVSKDGTTLFVADAGNNAIRAVSMFDGRVRTLAGSGKQGSQDGIGTHCSFYFPSGVTVSPDGATLIVADTWNNRIRSVDVVSGQVTTLAGTGERGFLSQGTHVAFNHPMGIVYHGQLVFVSDSGNNVIRNLTAISTVDTRLTMVTPYRSDLIPNVAFSIKGENVSLGCKSGLRAGPQGNSFAFCSASAIANATCSECVGSNALASYSGEDCLPSACDPFSNASHRIVDAIPNGNYGSINCNPGYRAKSYVQSLIDPPDCTFPKSFRGLCNNCNFDMRSLESADDWMTCSRIKCDLDAIRNMRGVSAVLPAAAQIVLFEEPIVITCNPGYRPEDDNVSSPSTVSTNCSDTCTTLFPAPVCKPVKCPAWALPDNSSILAVDYLGDGTFAESAHEFSGTLNYPQSLKIACDEGFKLNLANELESDCAQEYTVTCDENAELSNAQETCIPIKCPMVPNENSNSFLPHSRSIDFRTTTEAGCNVGYRPVLEGKTSIGCKATQVFEMTCEQCQLVTQSTCIECSVEGVCDAYEADADQTVIDKPERFWSGNVLTGLRGPFNLSKEEEIEVACPAGFAGIVPPLLMFQESEKFANGYFPVKCEYDGTLSREDGYCGCLPPSIEVTSDDPSIPSSCICPAGYYGSVPTGDYGSIDCKSCPQNSWSEPGTSTLDGCGCNAGYYSLDVTNCQACPPKSFSEFGSRVVDDCLCAAGMYKAPFGCDDCPANSHSDYASNHINDCKCNSGYMGRGETGCLQCDTESSTWRTEDLCYGFDDCIPDADAICDCKEGYYGDGEECIQCPGGADSPQGTSSVQGCQCIIGTYQEGQDCISCPSHSTTLQPGSTGLEYCLCDEGYYLEDGVCQRCPPEENGDFRKTSVQGSTNMSQCFCDYMYRPENGNCRLCPPDSQYKATVGFCVCDPGYDMEGSVEDEDSICVACSIGKYWTYNSSATDSDLITTCIDCFPFSTTLSVAGESISACMCLPGYSYPSFCSAPDPITSVISSCGPCQQCPAGKYSSAISRSPCENCPDGSFVDFQKAEHREDCVCNIGYEAVGDGCELCPAGKFYANNGTCRACQSNSYSTKGSTTCFCNAGHFASDDSCTECAAGTYKGSTGSGTCTPCPDASNSMPGAAICKCTAGYELIGQICQACPHGKYKPAASEVDYCINCMQQMTTASDHATSEEECQCMPGWFETTEAPDVSKSGDFSRFCLPCEVGKYKTSLGSEPCDFCAYDEAYSREASKFQTDCQCPKGQEGSNGAFDCERCPRSTYKPSPGTDSCLSCPAPSITLNEGSGHIEDCLCPPGTMPDPMDPADPPACIACNDNSFKKDPGPQPCQECTFTECPPGFYRTACRLDWDSECTQQCSNAPLNSEYTSGGKPFDVNNCDFKRTCDETLFFEAITDQITGLFLGCGCMAGYEGEESCSKCQPGKYKSESGASFCQSCDVSKYQPFRGKTVCLQCPVGAGTPSLGSQNIVDCTCNAGFRGLDGGGGLMCEPGTFSRMSSSSSCIVCQGGTYSNSGASRCLTCTEFSQSQANASQCLCNAGYQPTGDTPPKCTKCPFGTYKTSVGMDQCEDCSDSVTSPESGEYVGCVCRKGYHKLSHNVNGNCSACDPGHYSDVFDSVQCTPCAQDTYQETRGQSTCHPCPSFSSTAITGSADHCDCKCNTSLGYRWEDDVNATGNRSYCPLATLTDFRCVKSCPMDPGDKFSLSPVSDDFLAYPILGALAHLTCKVGNRIASQDGCQKTMQLQCGTGGTWSQDVDDVCTPLSCRFINPDENALPAIADVPYPNVVDLQCKEGYEIANPSQPKPRCQDDCQMHFMNFSCLPKTCTYSVSNTSQVDLQGVHFKNLTTQFPKSISLACKHGFVSSETCVRFFTPECLSDANFSLQVEPCIVPKCGRPMSQFEGVESDPNLNSIAGYDYDTQAQLTCAPGYVAMNISSGRLCSGPQNTFPIRCSAEECTKLQGYCGNCKWHAECKCFDVKCPPFETPANAIMIDPAWNAEKIFALQEETVVQCLPGFQIVNTTTCSKSFVVTCSVEGTMDFPGCEPVKCPHRREDFVDYTDADSQSYALALDTVVLVTEGPTIYEQTVDARCNSEAGYLPEGSISEKATCGDACMLEGLPVCFLQECDPYEPMSKANIAYNLEILNPTKKRLRDSFEVVCRDGYFADDLSVLPGLEGLGSVTVLAFTRFARPDPNALANVVFEMTGAFSAISISIPPGAWPPDLAEGPSAAVFTPPARRRRAEARLLVIGPYVSFGPAGANFSIPLTISCPFNLSGVDEGNLEIRIHRYDSSAGTYTPLPYPTATTENPSPVDKVSGSVRGIVSIFEPPYVACATNLPPTSTPAPPEAPPPPPEAINASQAPEEEKAASFLAIIMGFVGGAVVGCSGFVYVLFRALTSRKVKSAGEEEPEKEAKKEKATATEGGKGQKAAEVSGKKKDKMEPGDTVVENVEADLVVVGSETEVLSAKGNTPAADLRGKSKNKKFQEKAVAEEVAI